ncbi:MAG: hypothetical protein JOZ47_05940 [Kutzneria sp.]|nr:hypothetical protein [Kutzneria sp.]
MTTDDSFTSQDLYFVPLGTALGGKRDLAELSDLDAEQVARYRSFGYQCCRVADTDVFSLCFDAVKDSAALAGRMNDVDLFCYAIEPNIQSSNNWMLNEQAWRKRDIRWLIQQLDIHPKRIVGLSMYNCATFLSGIDIAAMAIRSGAASTALSIVAGVANEHSPRIPHAFHVQSDGATGFLVTGDTSFPDGYRIVSHVIDYVNPSEFRSLDGTIDETRYFTLKALKIRDTIEGLLSRSQTAPEQLERVFVQNLGQRAMLKYGGLCGVTEDTVWLDSLAGNAHVIGIDSLVNFHEYHQRSTLTAGRRVLIVGTSGMSWGGMVLERGH